MTVVAFLLQFGGAPAARLGIVGYKIFLANEHPIALGAFTNSSVEKGRRVLTLAIVVGLRR